MKLILKYLILIILLFGLIQTQTHNHFFGIIDNYYRTKYCEHDDDGCLNDCLLWEDYYNNSGDYDNKIKIQTYFDTLFYINDLTSDECINAANSAISAWNDIFIDDDHIFVIHNNEDYYYYDNEESINIIFIDDYYYYIDGDFENSYAFIDYAISINNYNYYFDYYNIEFNTNNIVNDKLKTNIFLNGTPEFLTDDSWVWTEDVDEYSHDIQFVITHELGHVLGLDHNTITLTGGSYSILSEMIPHGVSIRYIDQPVRDAVSALYMLNLESWVKRKNEK